MYAQQRKRMGHDWLIPLTLILAGLQWSEARAENYGYGPSPYPPAPKAVQSAYMTQSAGAAPWQEDAAPVGSMPLAEIEARVEAAMETQLARLPADGTRYSYRINPLDPRLRLAECPIGLQVERVDRGTLGRATFRISCTERNPWAINVSGEIEGWREVLVAARPLRHRTILNRHDVRSVEKNISELHRSYYEDPAEVEGLLIKRSVRENEVIRAGALTLPKLVRRGQPVPIVASSGSVRIRVQGVALSDGSEGDRIRVRNPRSGRVVQGEVSESGEVLIRL